MRYLTAFASISILAAPLTTPTGCGAQERPAVPELSFWTVGSSGVADRFGPDFYTSLGGDRVPLDRILLAIAELPRTRDEILEATGIPGDRLRELLSRLEALHVVRRSDGDRWATTVPVVTDAQMLRLRLRLRPVARAVAREVGAALPELTATYARTKASTDPPWERVAHLLIDKFLIDGSFHSAISRLETEQGIDSYYDREQRIIPAFFLERGEHFATFGTNWYGFDEGASHRSIYVLHGSVLNRYGIRMNAHRGDKVLSAALFALGPDGGTEALSESQRSVLRDLEWTEGDRLMVPVIQGSTIKALLPGLDEIGATAAEVVFDDYSTILDAFDTSPYAGFLPARGDYLQVCYHVLFGVSLEAMAEAGVIPAFPDPAPESFGVYVIVGKVF